MLGLGLAFASGAAWAVGPWPSTGPDGNQTHVALDPWNAPDAARMHSGWGPLNYLQRSGWIKHSAAVVADLDGNSTKEVIVGSYDGKVYVFGSDGSRYPGWPRTTGAYSTPPGPIDATAAVGDIDGDGAPEIVSASENGWVFAWNPDGSLVSGWPQFTGWNADYPAYCAEKVCTGVWASPTIADIDADRRLDVVVGSWSHLVWAWDGAGRVKPGWPRDVWDGVGSSAAIDDLDGDGNLDIVFGSDTFFECSNCQPYGFLPRGGKIHAKRLDGNELPGWPRFVDAFPWSSPTITDLNGDGSKDVVVGVGLWPGDFSQGAPGNRVNAFDRFGNTLWSFAAIDNVIASPAVADLDANGTKELAFGDISGWLYLLDARNGALIWRSSATYETGLPNSYVNSPAIGDIDGDGAPEIVAAGSNDGMVRAWSRTGSIVWRTPWTGFGIFASPTLADLDNSGKTWVIAGTGKGNGDSSATPERLAGTGALYAWKTAGNVAVLPVPGFHQPGPQPKPQTVQAFGIGFAGGVEIAMVDSDGDAKSEIVAAAGPGGGPNVKVIDPLSATAESSFMAYGAFTGGVRVATGSFTGPNRKEIVVAPGPGGGPNVRVFPWNASGVAPTPSVDFMAYGSFTGGVFVGALDADGDGIDEIVTAPGAGGGPDVRLWKVNGASATLMAKDNAYGSFTGGVRVAGGDYLKAGGGEQLVTAPGAGGGPDVRAYDVDTTSGAGGLAWSLVPVTRFWAADCCFTGGIAVGTLPGGLARDRILTGPGSGGGMDYRTISLSGSMGSVTPVLEQAGLVYPPTVTNGLRVAAGDVDGNATQDRVAALGQWSLPILRWFPG